MKRLFPVFLALILCVGAYAQGPSDKTTKTAAKPTKPASNTPAQPVDQEYTNSIIKNTTDKMFLTELVDHLPSSATVPSPAKILGYPIGTPNKLTYTSDQYRY